MLASHTHDMHMTIKYVQCTYCKLKIVGARVGVIIGVIIGVKVKRSRVNREGMRVREYVQCGAVHDMTVRGREYVQCGAVHDMTVKG